MHSLSEFYLPQRIEMADNQVLTLKGRGLEIACLAGLIWITDGVGGDRVVQRGQHASLSSKGRICVQAFAPSVVGIRSLVPAAESGLQVVQECVRECCEQ